MESNVILEIVDTISWCYQTQLFVTCEVSYAIAFEIRFGGIVPFLIAHLWILNTHASIVQVIVCGDI